MSITSAEITEFKLKVESIPELPALPHVVMHLNRMMSDPKVDASQVGEILSQDPSICARVLSLANSAFYGMRSRIDTITRATVVLGFNAVHSIALTVSVLELFDFRDMGGVCLSADDFWKHTIGTACITRLICRETGIENPETGWIAGLLHDLGKVILCQYFHREFKEILNTVHEKDILFVNAERSVIGVTHGNIGKWLAEKWALPPSLQEAIAMHHNPFRAEYATELTTAVYIADAVCRMKKIGSGGDAKVPGLDRRAFEGLGITAPMMKRIMAGMNEEVEKAFQMFSWVKE